MSSNGFTRVSNMILNDNDLNIYEKYFIIALKSFDYKNIGEVYPTYEALLKLFGTKNRNTIANLIKSLKDKNYIITMKKDRANCYKFIKDYLAGGNSCIFEVQEMEKEKVSCNSDSDSNIDENDAGGINLNTTSNSSDTTNSNRCDTSNSNISNTIDTKVNISSNAGDTRSSNRDDTRSSNENDTSEFNYSGTSNESDTTSSNRSVTRSSNGNDTSEFNYSGNSNECDTTSSNRNDTRSSNGSDTSHVNYDSTSNESDTTNSNASDTSSSNGSDTLIKQYKNKKEIYIKIFNKWNEKNISKEAILTVNIANCIESALRMFTLDQILQTIDNYAEVYHSKFYYDYLWDLKSFLIKPNGIYKFTPEGHLWKSYLKTSKETVKVKASEYID